MQLLQQRVGVRLPRRLQYDSRGVVLHSLQLLNGAGRSAVKQRVAVVDSRENQTTCKRLRLTFHLTLHLTDFINNRDFINNTDERILKTGLYVVLKRKVVCTRSLYKNIHIIRTYNSKN